MAGRLRFRFSEPQGKLSPAHGIQQRFRPVDFVGNGPLLLVRHPSLPSGLVANVTFTEYGIGPGFQLWAISSGIVVNADRAATGPPLLRLRYRL
jgi:hypothetical protein